MQHSDLKVIEILTESFYDNPSVSWTVGARPHRRSRVAAFFRMHLASAKHRGKVLLSEEAAALCEWRHDRGSSLSECFAKLSFFLLQGIGLRYLRIRKRNLLLKSIRPQHPYLYLTYIGVRKESQSQGAGRQMLNEVLRLATSLQLPVYLETSNRQALDFYLRAGFYVYHELKGHGFTCWFITNAPVGSNKE